ncbi:hypothetical protein [Oceanibacterium hippocampi]|uniref:Lipoprotein n=1 Tax=Oceanibacterium hippocampi TaxID=745714 RepID=A0A1Y5TY98_9PROT|nr:hypothetical protein [Oceanibacterium hippocampi]SLN73791.1 hypothetical protein OCH7691_03665 [Oceanibacterium hippocampi]
MLRNKKTRLAATMIFLFVGANMASGCAALVGAAAGGAAAYVVTQENND